MSLVAISEAPQTYECDVSCILKQSGSYFLLKTFAAKNE